MPCCAVLCRAVPRGAVPCAWLHVLRHRQRCVARHVQRRVARHVLEAGIEQVADGALSARVTQLGDRYFFHTVIDEPGVDGQSASIR